MRFTLLEQRYQAMATFAAFTLYFVRQKLVIRGVAADTTLEKKVY